MEHQTTTSVETLRAVDTVRKALLQQSAERNVKTILGELALPLFSSPTRTPSSVEEVTPQLAFEALFCFSHDVLPAVRDAAFGQAVRLAQGIEDLAAATKERLDAAFTALEARLPPANIAVLTTTIACPPHFGLLRDVVATSALGGCDELLMTERALDNEHKLYSFGCSVENADRLGSWLWHLPERRNVLRFPAASLRSKLLLITVPYQTVSRELMEHFLWTKPIADDNCGLFVVPSDSWHLIKHHAVERESFDSKCIAELLFCSKVASPSSSPLQDAATTPTESQQHPIAVVPWCPERWCTNTAPEHISLVMHAPPPIRPCSFDAVGMRAATSAIDFNANVRKWTAALERAFETKRWKIDKNGPAFREIVAWFESLRPVHMCSADVLVSMVKIATVASLGKLSKLWKTASAIAELVWLRSDATAVAARLQHEDDRIAHDFVFWYARSKQGERGPLMVCFSFSPSPSSSLSHHQHRTIDKDHLPPGFFSLDSLAH